MVYIQVEIKGTRPLMVHAPTTVDPRHPTTKEIKKITAKKTNKTEDDLDRLSELEFKAGLYLDPVTQEPYYPGRNLKAALIHGGKKCRQGESIREAVVVLQTRIPILYKGPKTWKELFDAEIKTADGAIRPYVKIEPLKVKQSRVIRTRPLFPEWAMKAHLCLDESVVDFDVLGDAVEILGSRCGIGECRPDFGRFEVIEFLEVSEAEGLAAIN